MEDLTLARRARIGQRMGETPPLAWAVMNRAETAYVMHFDHRESSWPEADAKAWLADFKERFPERAATEGYHVVRLEEWPDYLGELGACAAQARFMEWAFRQPELDDPVALLRLRKTVQTNASLAEALADTLKL